MESTLLLTSALGVSKEWLALNPGSPVPSDERSVFQGWIRKRSRRYPIQYLIGEWGFWKDLFLVREGVLVPRPETETLVEAALSIVDEKRGAPLTIFELGVGTGALLLSLLRECHRAIGYGMDSCAEAVELTRMNAARLNVKDRLVVWRGDMDGALSPSARFDLILFNPPYLNRAELKRMQPELKFESRGALDGGALGMDFYAATVPTLARRLVPGGAMLMEVSPRRALRVERLFSAQGLVEVRRVRDLSGRDRCVVGKCGHGQD